MSQWRIKYEGSPESGGTVGKYTCPFCGKSAYATEFPRYFEDENGHWHDPKYCPNCGHNMNDYDKQPTIAEVIRNNMDNLMWSYKEYGQEEDSWWWEDDCGGDYLFGIDCHVVFQGDPPCLLDERGISIDPKTPEERRQMREACNECKAIWLMGKWE